MTHDLQGIQTTIASHKARFMGHQEIRESAVLVPLVEREGELYVLFEVRSQGLRKQPGEICFPGGGVELGDGSRAQTAVRETCEELNVRPEQIEVLGELDVLVSQAHLIYAFVGHLREEGELRPNEQEVAEVFAIPLQTLRTTEPEMYFVDFKVEPREDFPFHLIPNGRAYNWRHGRIPQYFYQVEGRVIWGLTARIVHHFLELLRA